MKTAPAALPFLPALIGLPPAGGAAEGPGTGPVIDTHMHAWGDDPTRFPSAHPYDPEFDPPKLAASRDRVVREVGAHRVSHCVLVQTIYHGWDNRYLAHCLRADPDRFRGQGLIDPTDPNAAGRLGEVMRVPGMAGVRLSPVYYKGEDDRLDARSGDPLREKAGEPGAVFNPFIAAEQLPRLEARVRRFPKVRVVIDHLARVGPGGEAAAAGTTNLLALARYPDVSVKVSELMVLSPSGEYPYRGTDPLARAVYEAFGGDRLLWGTGFPGGTRARAGRPSLGEELALIRKEVPFFWAEDRAKIPGGNAARLWGFGDAKKGN
jgi:predicted TIM-barrel fold metal-dependent hydrolase